MEGEPGIEGLDEPVMAPILIHSEIPELEGQVDTRMFACINLTWKEFIEMFNVYLDPNEHVVKGTGGREFRIDTNIGDYISTFKRKLQVHPVTIEKIKKVKPAKSVSPVPPVKLPYTGKKRGPKKRRSPPSKRRKIVKSASDRVETTDGNHNMPAKNSPVSIDEKLEAPPEQLSGTGTQDRTSSSDASIPQSINEVVTGKPTTIIEAELVPPTPSSPPTESVSVVNGTVALSEINESTVFRSKEDDWGFPIYMPSHGASNVNNELGSESKSEKALVPFDFIPPPNPPRGRNRFRNENGRFISLKEDKKTIEQFKDDSSDSDNESIIARNPDAYQRRPTPDLKGPLIYYTANKVSNKDMLRVRDELMKLREGENYFKLTAISPLAAGLLEQMLCRNLQR